MFMWKNIILLKEITINPITLPTVGDDIIIKKN